MGKLEVIFRIRLAYPLILMSAAEPPAVVKFPESSNTVRIEVPQVTPPTSQPALEGFDQMIVIVERECTDQQGTDTSQANQETLQIYQNASTAFWQLFEAIRESALRQDNTVFMYPVIPTPDIRRNPLVRSGESEWLYNGNSLERTRFGPNMVPVIQITDDWWGDAVKRLGEANPVPVYRRFASDAVYFAEHDPPRGIIMACAAWETALRVYLATVASKRDPSYELASELRGIPTLYRFVQKARGGPVFYDWIGGASPLERQCFESFREIIGKLGTIRNKLLHEGEANIPPGTATDSALAVMTAIDWLFG